MSKDSRRAPRAKILSLTVRYKSATVAEFVENHSYDVSRGGIFIKTASPFPTGTLIKFEVRIAEEQSVMTGVGRVTWRRERDRGPEEPAGMGVKFIKIDDDSVAVIDRLVAARSDAPSNFEDGATKQGMRLSDPPAASASDRSSSRPPPSSDMLDQSSELLKSAVGSLRPGQLPSDGKAELPSGDDLEDSDLFNSVGAKKRDNDAVASSKPDVTSKADDRDDEVTMPGATGSLRSDSASDDDTDSSNADDDLDESDSEEDSDDDDSDEDTTARADSGRPGGKRGKGKKKKNRKKKKKFKYANIPSARTDSDSPRSARQAVGSKRSVEPPVSSLTTTPPTRRDGSGSAKEAESKSSSFGLIAIVLVAAIGVGYWFMRGSGKDSSQPTPEPPAAAEASGETSAAPSSAEPSASQEPSTNQEPGAAAVSAESGTPEHDAGAGGAANDDEATEAESTATTATAAPPKRPVKRPYRPRKPPKAPPKPEATTPSPGAPGGSTTSSAAPPSTTAFPAAPGPKPPAPETTPQAAPPKPVSPPASAPPSAKSPASPSPPTAPNPAANPDAPKQ